MEYPTNKNEWWQLVNDNWDDLKQIVLNYYPCQVDFPKKGWNTENNLLNPQAACNKVIKDLREEQPIWGNKDSFADYLERLRETENSELASIFNTAWFGIPESQESRRISGFYIFCDLCSEAYVLYER